MCPLVVESSISSSPLPLAVNDRQSQSHQLDSTSSTGNRVPLFYKHTVHNVDRNIHIKHTHICLWTETFRADHLSNWHGCQKTLNYWLFFMLNRQKSTQHHNIKSPLNGDITCRGCALLPLKTATMIGIRDKIRDKYPNGICEPDKPEPYC